MAVKGSTQEAYEQSLVVPYDAASEAMALQRAAQAQESSDVGSLAQASPGIAGSEDTVPVFSSTGEYKRMSRRDAILAGMTGGRVATPAEAEQQDAIQDAKRKIESTVGSQVGAAGIGGLAELIPVLGPKMARAVLESGGLSEEDAQRHLEATMQTTGGKIGGFISSLAPMLATEGGAELLTGGMQAAKQAGVAAAKEGFKKIVAREALSNAAYSVMDSANEAEIMQKPITLEDLTHAAVLGGALGVGIGVPLRLAHNKLFKYKFDDVPQKFEMTAAAPNAQELTSMENLKLDPVYTGAEAQVGKGFKPAGITKSLIEKGSANVPQEAVGHVALAEGVQGAENRFLATNADDVINKAGSNMGKMFKELETVTKENDLAYRKDKPAAFAAAGANVPLADAKIGGAEAVKVIDDLRTAIKNDPLLPDSVKRRLIKSRELSKEIPEIIERRINKSTTAGEVALGVDEARAYLQQATMRASAEANAGKAWIGQREAAAYRNLAAKASEDLQKLQRNKTYFGDIATAIGPAYDQQSKHLFMQGEMRRLGLMGKAGADPNDLLGDKLKKLNLGAIMSALSNPSNPANAEKVAVLRQYLGELTGAVTATSKHLRPTPAMAKTLEKMGDIANALEAHFRLIERAGAAKEAVQAYSKAGLGPIETAARMAAIPVGGMTSAMGHATGIPGAGAISGLAGYQAANRLATVGNPAKYAAYRMSVESTARAAEANRLKAAQKLAKGNIGVPPTGIIDARNYNQVSAGIRQALADQARFGKAVTAAMGGAVTVIPKSAIDIQLKSQQALAILAAATPPVQSDSNLLQPQFNPQIPPSDAQVHKANVVATAVFRPDLVYSHPTREGVQVVKLLYPNYHADMVAKIGEALATSKTPMTFNMRQYMSIVFDMKTDSIQDPAKWAILQTTLTAPPAQPKGAQSSVKFTETLQEEPK